MSPTPASVPGFEAGSEARLEAVADRVWVTHADPVGSTARTTVVAGDDGVLVVDPPAGEGPTTVTAAAVDRLTGLDVVAVVLTHGHRAAPDPAGPWSGARVHSHEGAGHGLTYSSVAVLDLGGRVVELVHPGRAHTAGDTVLHVLDADVVVTGDVVDGTGVPAYGPDSFPLEWPESLDLVVGLLTPATVVVPGRGAMVDKQFVAEQRAEVAQVAETLRGLVVGLVPEAEALGAAEWPFPPERLEHAVRRGYAQVPRVERRLPLA